jgi:two-component system, OmpR family, response regulator ChvI
LKNILVVDDEIDVTYTFRKMLEGDGHRVDTFNDPVLASKAFKTNTYDLVLLDIRMPNMDGFELYSRIRKKDAKAEVVFMSAYEVYREQFGELHDSNKLYFIKKPVDLPDLRKIIDKMP